MLDPNPSPNVTDQELVSAVRRGEPAAREQFAERMRCIPRILCRKIARTGAVSMSELPDLAQETFALVWERLERYQGAGTLEAWAYRFCCNVLMNAQQRRGRSRKVEVEDPEPIETSVSAAAESLQRDFVVVALAQLDPSESTVVRLKIFEGLTFEEIGERLHISPNTAKTRFYRQLVQLKSWLGKQGSKT